MPPFTIPNEASAAFADQSEVDQVDLDIIVSGMAQRGVKSDGVVSAHGGTMSVDITAGLGAFDGTEFVIPSTSGLAVTAADAALYRVDLVVCSTAGAVSVTAGTPAATTAVVTPAIPANSIVLAMLLIQPACGSIVAGNITAKGITLVGLFTPGASGGQSITGGNAASENLILKSTSNATLGAIQFEDTTFSVSKPTATTVRRTDDTNDYEEYDRTANTWTRFIGSTGVQYQDASGFRLLGYGSVGKLTAPANAVAGVQTATKLVLGVDLAFASLAANNDIYLQLNSGVGVDTSVTNRDRRLVYINWDYAQASGFNHQMRGLIVTETASMTGTATMNLLEGINITNGINATHVVNTTSFIGQSIVLVHNGIGGTLTFQTGLSINASVGAGVTGAVNTLQGLVITTTYGPTSAAATLSNYNGISVTASISSAMGATVSNMNAFMALLGGGSGGAAPTITQATYYNTQVQSNWVGKNVTLLRGLHITNIGGTVATITTSVGIDIDAQGVGPTSVFGIRNASNMVQTGYMSLQGIAIVPATVVDGDFNAVRLNIGNNSAFQTVSASAQLVVADSAFTSDGATFDIRTNKSATAGQATTGTGLDMQIQDKSTSGTQTAMRGFRIVFQHTGAAALTEAAGFESLYGQTGAGTVTSFYSFRANLTTMNSGTLTNHIGFRIENLGNAQVTNAIGLDIIAQTGATTNIGIKNASNMRQTGYLSLNGTGVPSNTIDGDLSAKHLQVGASYALVQLDDNGWDASLGFTPRTDWANTSNGASVAIKGGIGAVAGINQDIRQLYVEMNDQTSSGTQARITAIRMRLNKSGASTTTNIHAFAPFITVSAGTVGTAATIRVFAPATAGGAITNFTGIVIENHGSAQITNAIGLDIDAQANAVTLNLGIRNTDGRHDTGTIAASGNPAASYVRMWALTQTTGVIGPSVRFMNSAGHDAGATLRGRNVFPVPMTPYTSAKVAITPTTIQGRAGMVCVETGILLHAISFNISTASAGANGILRLAVYSETGVLVATVASAAGAVLGLGINTLTLGADVYIPAGNYYVATVRGVDYATTQPVLSAFTQDNTFQAVAGQEVSCGTYVAVGGANPDPIGTITSADNSTPMFKFYGTAL